LLFGAMIERCWGLVARAANRLNPAGVSVTIRDENVINARRRPAGRPPPRYVFCRVRGVFLRGRNVERTNSREDACRGRFTA